MPMLPPDYTQVSSTLDCILPGYNTTVSLNTTADKVTRRASMSIKVADRRCNPGCFISGLIAIIPKETLTPENFTISIIGRERAGRYGRVTPKVLRSVISVSTLPNTTTLLMGKCYNVKFSIKFPEDGWLHTCKCGAKKPHAILPPSFGQHNINAKVQCCSDYVLIAQTKCGKYCAQEYLSFSMNSQVSFNGLPSHQFCWVPNSITNSFKENSRIFVQVCPLIYFVDCGLNPVVSLDLIYSDTQGRKPPNISRIEHKVLRHTSWWRNHTGNRHLCEQVICSGYSTVTCNWDNDRTNIVFTMKLEPSHSMESSYNGCLTSISYSVRLYFARIMATQNLTVATTRNLLT